jgi:chromosomal replication initiation ATPase DnaA
VCNAGRQQEMGVFVKELNHVSERTHRDINVIIITGSGGIGKTKLLRAMKAKAALMNFR